MEYQNNGNETIKSQKGEETSTNDTSQLIPKDIIDKIFITVIKGNSEETNRTDDQQELINEHN